MVKVVFDPVKHVGEKGVKRKTDVNTSNNKSRAIQAYKKGMTKINEILKVSFLFIK